MDNSTNATDDADEGPQWFELPGWRWAFFNIIIWLMPILLVFGILFNLLCFITILHSVKTFPKISRRSMLIITGCDVLVLAVGGVNSYHIYWNRSMGFSIYPSFMNHQSDSPAACYIINFLYKYFLNGTPFFHVGLTVERVLAVVMPLKVKRIMTVRNHNIMLAVLLIIGSMDSVLWSVEQGYYDGKCDANQNQALVQIVDKLQYTTEFYVSKVSLFLVLLTGCIIVAVALKLQTSKVARMSGNAASLKRGKMVGACATMIAMNIVFFLVHAPRAAFSVYEGYINMGIAKALPESEITLIYSVAEGVMYLHGIADPFAYFIGQGFRTAFKRTLGGILCLGWLRRQQRTETAASAASVTGGGSGPQMNR